MRLLCLVIEVDRLGPRLGIQGELTILFCHLNSTGVFIAIHNFYIAWFGGAQGLEKSFEVQKALGRQQWLENGMGRTSPVMCLGDLGFTGTHKSHLYFSSIMYIYTLPINLNLDL